MYVFKWICLSLCVVFLLFALPFAVLKEKAAMLVSGFNTLPRRERAHYDRARLARDTCRLFVLWAGVLGAGALLSHFVWPYAALAAIVLWVVLFCREVHWDTEKAFGKYRLPPDGDPAHRDAR